METIKNTEILNINKIGKINPKILNEKQILLDLNTSPYLGVYSNNYEFFLPILTVTSRDIELNKNHFPDLLHKALYGIDKQLINFMIIDVDATHLIENNFNSGNDLTTQRVNLVLHPYLFYNVDSIEREHKDNVYNAIFKIRENHFLESNYNENDRICINPEKFFDKNCLNEVILHEAEGSAAISPNNNTFLINVYNTSISFYYMCAVIYKNSLARVLVTRFNINQNCFFPFNKYLSLTSELSVNENTLEYLSNLVILKNKYSLLLETTINFIFRTFYKSAEKISNIINYKEKLFELFFCVISSDNKYDIINFMDFSKQDFGKFVDSILNSHRVKNFSKLLCFEISDKSNYDVEFFSFFFLLCKYVNYKINSFNSMINSKFTFYELDENLVNLNSEKSFSFEQIVKDSLNELKIKKDYKEIFCLVQEDIVDDKIVILKVNKEKISIDPILLKNIFSEGIKAFEKLMNCALSNPDNIVLEVTNLPIQISEYLYYKTWSFKGRIEGISSNFGKYSLLNSNLIPSCYFCSPDEIVEIILNCYSSLEKIINY